MTRLRLTRILAERGLHEEAASIGLDPSELSRCERLLIQPTPRIIGKLEKYYGVSVGHLLSQIEPTTLAV